MIILHLLDFSLFMSLFLVLLALTLNDTEQKARDTFSKMTPTFICRNKRAQELTFSSVPYWYLSKVQKQLFGGINTYKQMQANYANRITAGWTRAAAWSGLKGCQPRPRENGKRHSQRPFCMSSVNAVGVSASLTD